MKYQFKDCNCIFNIKSVSPFKLETPVNLDTIPLDCTRTWKWISDGRTGHLFQLESGLGKSYSRKLKPENIEQLSAQIAIVRPGTLNVLDEEGVSAAEHFCRRKNKEEEVPSFHPIVDEILKDTFGVLIYQESSIEIAKQVANFTLVEADSLRKAMGKKDAAEMTKVKTMFLSKAKEAAKLPFEQCEALFDWIQKSNRYLFNKSHSMSYAYHAYYTAYFKSHMPRQFYLSWLKFHKYDTDPQNELKTLVRDAKDLGLKIGLPDLRYPSDSFFLNGDIIQYGLTDIKGVGVATYASMLDVIKDVETKLGKKLSEWRWKDFLFNVATKVNKTAIEALINAGATDFFGVSRINMSHEFKKILELTDKEMLWIISHQNEFDNLLSALKSLNRHPKDGGGINLKSRATQVAAIVKLLEEQVWSVSSENISKTRLEQSLLGTHISCHITDWHHEFAAENFTKCIQFSGLDPGIYSIIVQVDESREFKIRKGKNKGNLMGFLNVSDSTGSLENLCVFSDLWNQHGSEFEPGNILTLRVKKDEQNRINVLETSDTMKLVSA